MIKPSIPASSPHQAPKSVTRVHGAAYSSPTICLHAIHGVAEAASFPRKGRRFSVNLRPYVDLCSTESTSRGALLTRLQDMSPT